MTARRPARFFPLLAAAVLGLFAAEADAALIAPVKAYVKPDEPVVVRFLTEKSDVAAKAVETVGLAAAQIDGLFGPAPGAEIAPNGKPAFQLVKWTGEAVPGNPTVNADGTLDLTAAYPTVRDGGTYFLVWKDAPPLVIENLYNPGRSAADLQKIQPQLERMTEDARKQALAQYGPVVTHLELAQIAVITTDKGTVKAKFAYNVAPHTIDNFVTLSRQGFYDGSAFHRIIKGFMIQGGDALANVNGMAGTGGPGYQIMKEFSDKRHLRGVLSMARSSDPNSAGSQFFIMHGAAPSLDGAYSAFGDVYEGMDVVDAIAGTPSEPGSGAVTGAKPKILSIKILPATASVYGLTK